MPPDDPSQRPVEHFGSRLEFETLISDLSSRFVNLPAAEVDSAIEDAQRRVCEFLGVDRSVLWQRSMVSPSVLAPTHVYFAHERAGSKGQLRQDTYPWIGRQALAGRTVIICSLDDLPAEAAVDRENARSLGIKSGLILPLSAGGEPPVGVLTFTTALAERDWPDALVRRLELVARVFTGALLRRRNELSLQQRDARLTAAAELAGLAFYEVDFGRGAVFIDDRYRDLCGIPPEREEGFQPVEFWLDHLHPDDRQRVQEARRQLRDGIVDRMSLEYRYLQPSRGEKWFQHLSRIVERDATGRAAKTCAVIRDVTARRRGEEALRQSLVEIERLKDRLQAESDYLKAEIRVIHRQGEITGQSAAIQRVLRQVEQVAPMDSTVLVCGETGTGKELVAQAIHRLSPRKGHVLVKVNCAALPSGLVESELFGREKGAYTGALTRQIGRFEVADGSTLFLDEIGELSLELQAKLLRVLETGEFERLGSPRTVKVDVRVIAATNRDLAEEIQKGRFRQDLYYRLNVFPIGVPPLRERVEDIPQLVWTFLGEFSPRMGKTITRVPRTMMDALQRHRWPGNVRELRNVIERAAILTTGETLRVPALDAATPVAEEPPTLAQTEREAILRVLETTDWRIKGPKGAAVVLGLEPSTLYARMKKLGLWPRARKADGSA